MKSITNLIMCLCTMLAGILSFNNTNAAVISKKILNDYDGSFNITNASYDINGDNKKDQIQMIGSYNYYYETYHSLVIKINGITALNTSFDDGVLSIKVYYFKLKNNKEYLTVHATMSSDYSYLCNMYAYKSGKLKVIKNFESAFSWFKGDYIINSLKASGNNIVVNYSCDSDMIGLASFKVNYKYSSFASPTSVTFSRFYNYNNETYLISKTATQFPVYKTAGKTKKVTTIKKGTRFYPLGFKKVGGKLYYYVKVRGKKGYMLHKNSDFKYFKYETHAS